MSNPKKITIVHQVSVDTDVLSTNAVTDKYRDDSQKQSRKQKSQISEASIESITLQESTPRSQSLPLKASFLRRKAKEYEGKNISVILGVIRNLIASHR